MAADEAVAALHRDHGDLSLKEGQTIRCVQPWRWGQRAPVQAVARRHAQHGVCASMCRGDFGAYCSQPPPSAVLSRN